MHIMTLSYYICTQVEIPNTDTTYWCAAAELPQEVQQRQQYVVRVSSRITIVEYGCLKYNSTLQLIDDGLL